MNQQQVSGSLQLKQWTYVTERSTHNDGIVVVLLVVVEDLLNGLNTRVLVTDVVLARLVLLVPVKNLQ